MSRGIFAATLLFVSSLGAQTAAPGNDTIRKEALKADLFFLASDEMQGGLRRIPRTASRRSSFAPADS